MSAATARNALSVRAASTTVAPSRANTRAAAAPMPRLAPVTRAILSERIPMTRPCVAGRVRDRPHRYLADPRRHGHPGRVDKHELGRFLRRHRERLSPATVGLPAGGPRRTPGLRREEVAQLAHISAQYYTRLEQARGPHPSRHVLAAIGRALRL